MEIVRTAARDLEFPHFSGVLPAVNITTASFFQIFSRKKSKILRKRLAKAFPLKYVTKSAERKDRWPENRKRRIRRIRTPG